MRITVPTHGSSPALNLWDFCSSRGEGRSCAGRSISSSAVRAQRLLRSITTHNKPDTHTDDLNYFSSAIIPKLPEVFGSRKKEINEEGGRSKLRVSDVTDVGKLWLSTETRGRRQLSWTEMFSCWRRTMNVKEVDALLRCDFHWKLVSLRSNIWS